MGLIKQFITEGAPICKIVVPLNFLKEYYLMGEGLKKNPDQEKFFRIKKNPVKKKGIKTIATSRREGKKKERKGKERKGREGRKEGRKEGREGRKEEKKEGRKEGGTEEVLKTLF